MIYKSTSRAKERLEGFADICLSFLPHDIPALAVLLNKRTLGLIARFSIFQRFLAFKYRLRTLAALPFDERPLSFETPFFHENPFYGKLLNLKNLLRRLELSFEVSQTMEH